MSLLVNNLCVPPRFPTKLDGCHIDEFSMLDALNNQCEKYHFISICECHKQRNNMCLSTILSHCLHRVQFNLDTKIAIFSIEQ